METFRRKDGYVRYDWEYRYGVGRSPVVFWNNLAYPGVTYFFNSYRDAPIRFSLIHEVGMWRDRPIMRRWLYFTGSMVEPYASWYFRVGRVFVGGTTPQWMIKLYERYRRWQWYREAKATGEGLCPKCGKGLILSHSGYPGETFYQCDRCDYIEDYIMDYSAIE
jgi:ribosomal protein S27AE